MKKLKLILVGITILMSVLVLITSLQVKNAEIHSNKKMILREILKAGEIKAAIAEQILCTPFSKVY